MALKRENRIDIPNLDAIIKTTELVSTKCTERAMNRLLSAIEEVVEDSKSLTVEEVQQKYKDAENGAVGYAITGEIE